MTAIDLSPQLAEIRLKYPEWCCSENLYGRRIYRFFQHRHRTIELMIHQKSRRLDTEQFNPPLLASFLRKARAQRERAAEDKFSLWCERLADARSKGGNGHILECVLDAAVSLSYADRANIQLIEDSQLVIKGQRGFSAAFLDYFRILGESNTALSRGLEEPTLGDHPRYYG